MDKPEPVDMPHAKFERKGKTFSVDEPVLGYSKIELIGHALDRLNDWGLTKEDILTVLRNPDITGLPTELGRERYRRHKTTRSSVDVVFEKQDDLLRVITVIKIERRLSTRRRK